MKYTKKKNMSKKAYIIKHSDIIALIWTSDIKYSIKHGSLIYQLRGDSFVGSPYNFLYEDFDSSSEEGRGLHQLTVKSQIKLAVLFEERRELKLLGYGSGLIKGSGPKFLLKISDSPITEKFICVKDPDDYISKIKTSDINKFLDYASK